MNHGGILIFKNLKRRKNTNSEKKKRMNNWNLQNIKQDLAHPQKKSLTLKNILIEIKRLGNRAIKGQQKKIPEDIIHIIPHLLKVIRSINQYGVDILDFKSR